ncbi:PilZ domain-containing protein [Hydrocarboniclastica marina]|uniref:PilZ domain-containing protein n=1 Tax=Hydrocarboniclastica marina TaxID=2259620 RepID=A0A4P7XF83_9ALTE|nr:PilZ domain-containing protein [Hydrocarboniclastica marina]MAL98670.1 pilus assembly protein PilZ [Alteromonadaceae bacterium]QCF25588.1 PilZ domain-containing protein [Hydrocarboniclastica marina]
MSEKSIMRDFAEKRDFIRMQVNAHIELKVLSTGKSITAVCKDLSGMGMQVVLERDLAVGTEVQTALPSNSPEFPTFKTTAKVVRTERLENGYLAGLEIIKIEQ